MLILVVLLSYRPAIATTRAVVRQVRLSEIAASLGRKMPIDLSDLGTPMFFLPKSISDAVDVSIQDLHKSGWERHEFLSALSKQSSRITFLVFAAAHDQRSEEVVYGVNAKGNLLFKTEFQLPNIPERKYNDYFAPPEFFSSPSTATLPKRMRETVTVDAEADCWARDGKRWRFIGISDYKPGRKILALKKASGADELMLYVFSEKRNVLEACFRFSRKMNLEAVKKYCATFPLPETESSGSSSHTKGQAPTAVNRKLMEIAKIYAELCLHESVVFSEIRKDNNHNNLIICFYSSKSTHSSFCFTTDEGKEKLVCVAKIFQQ